MGSILDAPVEVLAGDVGGAALAGANVLINPLAAQQSRQTDHRQSRCYTEHTLYLAQ